jgi:hypothetical protein
MAFPIVFSAACTLEVGQFETLLGIEDTRRNMNDL